MEIVIEHLQPNVMMVGDTYDDALNLSRVHQELCQKLRAHRNEITENVRMKRGGELSNDFNSLWEPTDRQLQTRDSLLQQSVRFHQAADSVCLDILFDS